MGGKILKKIIIWGLKIKFYRNFLIFFIIFFGTTLGLGGSKAQRGSAPGLHSTSSFLNKIVKSILFESEFKNENSNLKS